MLLGICCENILIFLKLNIINKYRHFLNLSSDYSNVTHTLRIYALELDQPNSSPDYSDMSYQRRSLGVTWCPLAGDAALQFANPPQPRFRSKAFITRVNPWHIYPLVQLYLMNHDHAIIGVQQKYADAVGWQDFITFMLSK